MPGEQEEDQYGRSKANEEDSHGNEVGKIRRTCIMGDPWAVMRTSAFNLSEMGAMVGY